MAVIGWLVLSPSRSSPIEQIAVLPITDLSGSDALFVTAIHDALISSLARSNVAGVVSRTAVMKYQGSGEPTRQIAAALNADAIVEGTVFRDGNRMRINVQMVDPQSLRSIWAETYERDVSDVLDAQRDIVDQIASDIRGALQGSRVAQANPVEVP